MEATQSAEKITIETFRSMYFDDDDDFYYELMEGEMVKKSAPAPLHQLISGKLYFALETYNRSRNFGFVISAPVDVLLDKYNQFQPDLIFITGERKSIITNDGIKGAPDLVIEILSPSSIMRDRFAKKRVYERNGVKEYWLVSPEYEEIEVFVLKDNVYDLFSAATKIEGKLESCVLKEMQLDLKQLFLSDTE